MQLLEPLARNVGVDLCRRNVGMPQQQLNDAQIGAVIQQVRRKGMAQGVRR